MVYKFDPAYVNGSIFEFVELHMSGNFLECYRANKPIPASYFPKTLTVAKAAQALPDIFHTARDLIVFSERARPGGRGGSWPGRVYPGRDQCRDAKNRASAAVGQRLLFHQCFGADAKVSMAGDAS